MNKAIPGYEGLYEVSDSGEVWSLRCGKRKLLKAQLDTSGYRQVCLYKDKTPWFAKVSRLVLASFIGNSDGMEASHMNGCRTDDRLQNLAWETRTQNHARRASHGTTPTGERNSNAKLTCAQVGEIRRLRPTHTLAEIGKMFGVSEAQVWKIVHGLRWTSEVSHE